MTLRVSQCLKCVHRAWNKRSRVPTCKAFPDMIPAEVLFNEADHRKPFEGDNGVRFEALEGENHPFDGPPLEED